MDLTRISLIALVVVGTAGPSDSRAAAAQAGPPRDAIVRAVERGAAADIERLLSAGADPDVVGTDGVPLVMTATLFASADIVELLLKRGADPNRTDPAGATALMWAVPNLDKARVLLARGANANARSKTGRTPLLVAASYPGTVNVLRLLLDRGADLRAQDQAGQSALSLAVRSSDIDVVRFLVERGLDPATLTPGARRVAFARYDLPIVEFLLSKSPAPSPELLGTATTWQPVALVARLIESGADVNGPLNAAYARTTLMNAVTSEAAGADIVKLLLERGADVNAKTTDGETALDWAIYKGDRAKIQLLEQYRAVRGDGPRREAIAPPGTSGRAADARAALARSAARLLEVAPKFREQATCISCHHNTMPALAAAAVRRKGIAIDETRARKNLDDIRTFLESNAPRVMLGDPAVGGEALTAGYALMALAAERHPPDATTATMTHWLLARQMPDGRWLGNGLNRPPSEYSTISHTAIAAGGLAAYPLAAQSRQRAEGLRRAREWLTAAHASSAEERAMRLMGLVWTGAPRDRRNDAIKAIRDRQEPGGGWSQFGRTEPDAYATGLSLFAMQTAGVPASDDTYRKGVAFLLATQYEDGTWLVKTHAFPVQRYFESGFPFGRHQWISTAGTSWATLALAYTLPDSRSTRSE
jgi:N-acyl-D-amino-acid deacylase